MLFKVGADMAPGTILVNHITDVPLRVFHVFIFEMVPGAYLCDWINEQLQ